MYGVDPGTMFGDDSQWLQIVAGWGFVAAILTWLVMRWAFPVEEVVDDERHRTTWPD